MPETGQATYQLVRVLGPGVTLLVGLALERWRPHAILRPAWRTNLGLWAIDSLVMASVCGTCGWIVASWAASQGVGLLASAGAGKALAMGVTVLGLDAVSYAWHRANHRIPLLWRFHQVHHGDASFHVTTALRFHPGELLLALPVRLAAVVVLGAPPEGVLLFEVIFGAANLLEHGNFDLPRRLEHVVRRLLVTPSLHRGHHVSEWRELDTNFGTIFSLWDRMAATFHPSEPDRRVVTGLPDLSTPETTSLSWWLILPFTRRRSQIQ